MDKIDNNNNNNKYIIIQVRTLGGVGGGSLKHALMIYLYNWKIKRDLYFYSLGW